MMNQVILSNGSALEPGGSFGQFQVVLFSCDWRGMTPANTARLIRFREFPGEGDTDDGDDLLESLQIRNPELFGSGLLGAHPDPSDCWRQDGVLIRFDKTVEASPARVPEVMLTFDDGQTGKSYSEAVSLDPDSRVAVVFQRPGTDRVLVVALFPRTGERRRLPYAAAFKTDLFTVFSREGRLAVLGEGRPLTFRKADVVILEEGESRYLLRAREVIYSKQDRELIARNGVLFDVSGGRLIEGPSIRVTFEDGKVDFHTD